jgi:phosphatidylinositol alpha 1,6-mannosyltransferase
MIAQEALAAGVPVLAPDSGGLLDVVKPGQNGWLFRDGEAASLAVELEQLVRMRGWTALDRAGTRQTARRAGAVADSWCAVYDKL